MNRSELEGLLARLVDGEMTDTDDARLAAELRARPELVEEARWQLVISDLLSQEFDPRRSGEAFAASVRTRFAAEHTTTQFVETTVERIRRAEGPARPKPRRTLRWLLPVAACLAIVAGSVAYNLYQATLLPQRLVARVQATTPGVKIRREGSHVIATVGTTLVPGDRIETASGQRVTIEFPRDDAWMAIDGRTHLDFECAGADAHLRLDRGRIDVRVEPRSAGAPFTVKTKHADCEITGTRLLVTVRRDTRLEVQEGKAVFRRLCDGAAIEVATGQYAVASGEPEQLEAKALEKPSEPVLLPVALSTDGRELFRDDFAGGMDNWEALVEEPPGAFRPLREEESHLIEWQETEPVTEAPGAVVFHGGAEPGKTLAIRLRKRLDAPSLTVEYSFNGKSGAYVTDAFGDAVESDVCDYFGTGTLARGWNVLRGELLRLGSEGDRAVCDARRWYFRGRGEKRSEGRTIETSLLRVKDRRIIIKAWKKQVMIGDVVVRELAAPGEPVREMPR